jgi:hypothetical protein
MLWYAAHTRRTAAMTPAPQSKAAPAPAEQRPAP